MKQRRCHVVFRFLLVLRCAVLCSVVSRGVARCRVILRLCRVVLVMLLVSLLYRATFSLVPKEGPNPLVVRLLRQRPSFLREEGLSRYAPQYATSEPGVPVSQARVRSPSFRKKKFRH